MNTNRLEAFTDGVLAIVITIMVLDIKTPGEGSLAALESVAPILLTYLLSFVNIGIFWSNHHHMLHGAERIDGRALWANLFLLFWLTLVPLVIRWMGDTRFAPLPTAAYGVVLAMAAVGYTLLQKSLVARNGADSILSGAIGKDLKGKLSLALYLAAIPLAFVGARFAIAIYVFIALMWLAPDRRIERFVATERRRPE